MTTVTVSDGATSFEAVSTPQFVILRDGVYYVTQAVWWYDPAAAAAANDADQIAGCAEVAAYFAGAGPTYLQAAVVDQSEENQPNAVQPPPGSSTNPPKPPVPIGH